MGELYTLDLPQITALLFVCPMPLKLLLNVQTGSYWAAYQGRQILQLLVLLKLAATTKCICNGGCCKCTTCLWAHLSAVTSIIEKLALM